MCAVVSVIDQEGEAEVVYEAPAWEDGAEEDGEEVEYMPPPELDRDTVEREINECIESDDVDELWSRDVARRLQELLLKHWTVCSNRIGGVTRFIHRIGTKGGRPIARRMYRYSQDQVAEINRQVEELLERGLIEPCESEWATSPVLAKKKDGSWRMAIDYRPVNDDTPSDQYPLPRIDDILDAMAGTKIFSTLDLRWGFWQMPLAEEDKRAKKILLDKLWVTSGWKNEEISEQDLEYAKSKGVMFDPVILSHDNVVANTRFVIQSLDKKRVTDAFISSLTSRRLDLRSQATLVE